MHQVIRVAFLLGLLTGLLSSCTYTYIPPVPRGRVEPEASLDLHASTGIVTETRAGAQRLVLQLSASDVPEEDWLAVQWFAPDNQQVASASQWLEPSSDPQDVRFVLADITLRPGDWRAVVSYQNRVARQFSVVLEPPEAPPTTEPPTTDTPPELEVTPQDTPTDTPISDASDADASDAELDDATADDQNTADEAAPTPSSDSPTTND
jgi:hypothetical protein